MNIIQKSSNFIYFIRNGVSLKGSLYCFKGRLTDGDKFVIAALVLMLAIGLIVKNADVIDGVTVAEVRK